MKKSQVLSFLPLMLLLFSCAPIPQPTFIPPSTWRLVPESQDELIKYFDENKNNLNPVEGIWNYNEDITAQDAYGRSQSFTKQNVYELAIIKKNFTSPREFDVVIISSIYPHWDYPGRIKAELKSTAYKKSYTVKWFGGQYQPMESNFIIDENGLMKGVFDRWEKNVRVTAESMFIKSYPPFEDISTPQYISSNIKSTGSGFLISENGLIITNYHVVENAEKIEISFPNKNITKEVSLKLKDINNDLAILEIDEFDFNKISNNHIPYKLADIGDVKVGQEVFTLGFPLGSIMGSKSRLSTGRINSVYGIQEDPRLFQIGNPLQPGNSGGALFNTKGELVGVVVSGLNAKFFYDNLGIIPQNVNFAVKVSYLKNLLGMMPENDEILNRKSKISNLSMEDQVEKLDPFIVQIKVY